MVFANFDHGKVTTGKAEEGRKGEPTMDSKFFLHKERCNLRSNGCQRSVGMESENESSHGLVCSYSSKTKQRRIVGNRVGSDEALDKCLIDSNMEQRNDDEPQDADYSYIPLLDDEVARLILARVPRSEHPKLCCINKRYLALVKSGELSKIRRKERLTESSVIVLASGEHQWWEHSPGSQCWRKLPDLPCEPTFFFGDKETLCVGYSLLVSGIESEGMSIWRYEFLTNSWHKGPAMTTPRCLFASANCGDVAFVAGGIASRTGRIGGKSILNSAEQYDPVTKRWDPLPSMRKRRQRCSGCFMDNRFYVIGGMNEEGSLNCGEFYDRDKKTWHLVPDMFKAMSNSISQSPPLLAVVEDELYALEPTSDRLKLYLKKSNSWKDLGMVPVRANHNMGWGVAFKSLGDRLLILGAASIAEDNQGQGIAVFTCQPNPNAGDCQWEYLGRTGNFMGSFIFNCSIMSV
ncbi:F-box/kelch-repeat protein [Nymphaea thermarum]|nr:F-box/kelch-repeat protein [Nymphaea thermarum]